MEGLAFEVGVNCFIWCSSGLQSGSRVWAGCLYKSGVMYSEVIVNAHSIIVNAHSHSLLSHKMDQNDPVQRSQRDYICGDPGWVRSAGPHLLAVT